MTEDAADELRGWDRPAIIRVVRDIELEGREGTEPHWTAWRILEQLAATPASDRWLAESKLATLKGAESGHTAAALRLLTVDIARLRGAPESFVEVREHDGGRSYALREAAAPIVRAALVIMEL